MATYLNKEAIIVILICLLWYIVSSTNSIVGKVVLFTFPYPMTLTIIQMTCIFTYLRPTLYYLNISSKNVKCQKTSYILRTIAPIAFGKVFASITSHFSLWKVPVSYLHTVKSTMPIFIVLLTRFVDGEKQTNKIYLSLAPILGGVVIATITELNFDLLGVGFGLISILVFSLMNFFSKKVLKENGTMHHLTLLFILSKYALIMSLPVWLCSDFQSILALPNVLSLRIVLLLLFDGFLNFSQNILAFTLLSMVTPLTYSVCNVTKRIAVIVISLLTLRNPITFTNIFGMFIAVFGVFLYNQAKYEQMEAKKALPVYEKLQSNDSVPTNGHVPYSNGHIPNGYTGKIDHRQTNGYTTVQVY